MFTMPCLVIFATLWSIAEGCDGNACCYDADCDGNSYCPGGGGFFCKCADSWWRNKYNFGSCVPKEDIGERCGTSSNCASGNCMNSNILSRCPGTCGPSKEDGPCDEDSDCAGSGMFCLGGQTGISCGRCKRKYGNGEGTCTTDADCSGNNCRGISCVIPGTTKTCKEALCYEKPGWPVGTMCTEDRDCDQSKAWCDGGGVGKVGTCQACPAKCGNQGCNACNNDKTKMRCGKTTARTKATCAASVAADVLDEAFSCLGLDGVGDCLATAAKSAASCLTGGSCEIKFGYPTCSAETMKELISGDLTETDRRRLQAKDPLAGTWGEEEANFFSEDFGLTENLAFEGRKLSLRGLQSIESKSKITTKGKLAVAGRFLFTLDPKEGKLKFETKLQVTADTLAKFASTSSITNSKRDKKGKPAGPKKTVFSKFVLVGMFPVQLAVTIQPYVWIDYTAKGTFTASASVKKTASMTGSLTVSTLSKQVETDLVWSDSPLSTTVQADGQVDASFTVRLGVRVAVVFNGFKASADAAFALKANAKLALQGTCLSGTFGVGASADVSSNVNFEAPDPRAAAQAACLAGVAALTQNPVGAVANCIAKAATGMDVQQELQDLCSQIDSDPDRDVPSSTCKTTSALSVGDGSKWTSFPLAQAQVTVNGLCAAADALPMVKTSVSHIFKPPADAC